MVHVVHQELLITVMYVAMWVRAGRGLDKVQALTMANGVGVLVSGVWRWWVHHVPNSDVLWGSESLCRFIRVQARMVTVYSISILGGF